jgi:hypothetical protein
MDNASKERWVTERAADFYSHPTAHEPTPPFKWSNSAEVPSDLDLNKELQ